MTIHGMMSMVTGLKESCNFGNDTNNRLESINQKFKQVIERFGFASFEQFFHDLEVVLKCLCQERESFSQFNHQTTDQPH